MDSLRAALAVVASMLVIGLLVFAPGAGADVTFCPPGSGAGQCQSPGGLATDFETGRVYVADAGNNRIDVFESDGSFLFAFGWGVVTGAPELQKCTTVSGCLKGLKGSGTAQFESPGTVAVDNDPASPSHHDLYVGEKSNRRVQKFDPAGNFLLGFGWGVRNGSAEAQTCGPEAVPLTVNCRPGIEGSGKCQLGDSRGEPLSVGPGGVVMVADSPSQSVAGVEYFTGRIERFSASGVCLEEKLLFEKQLSFVKFLAADSSGNIYVALEGTGNHLQKIKPSGEIACEDSSVLTKALAVDPSGNLFAAQREGTLGGETLNMLTEYDSNCNPVRRFHYVIKIEPPGLAFFHSAVGDLFLNQDPGQPITYLPLPPPGPAIVQPSVEASSVSNTKATLSALVNPNGEPTEVRIEYVEQATCEKDESEGGECFEDATSSPPQSFGTADFSVHPVSAQFGCADPVKATKENSFDDECLTPETEYRFRVVAESPAGPGNSPVDGGSFETRPWLEVGSVWSSDVGPDAAQVHAEANPLGIATTGYFEYVDDAHFDESGFAQAARTPDVSGGKAPIDFGSGEAFVVGSASPPSLSPRTTYHYRLVVEDPLSGLIMSQERTFRTLLQAVSEVCPGNEDFRTGSSALLPDCRAYEMVSPLDKGNGDIISLKESTSGTPAVLNQSSIVGSRFAYGSYRAFGDAQSAPYTSQYIAARGEGGWRNHGISPPRGRLLFPGVFASIDTEFKAFSPDLCEAWLRPVAEPTLEPGAVAEYPNIYRKEDDECGGPSYEALTTQEWPNIAPGSDNEEANKLELQGVSADGSHAIFLAPDSLVGSGAKPQQNAECKTKGLGCVPELYVWAKGSSPVFVCVLPGGLLQGSCVGGTTPSAGIGRNRLASLQGAISADGSRIFWTASAGNAGPIYMREHAEQGKVAGECTTGKPCTIEVSRKGEELSGTKASQFQAAASDGSRAIFTTGPEAKEDLYEFDVDAKATQLIAQQVIGLLGVSSDASRVYFASREALGGANSEGDVAEPGKANLYLAEEDSISFIGILSNEDVARSVSPVRINPDLRVSRVTPDGMHAAFMSNAPLTGYDNADANTGEAADEVFVYDAESGKLSCASCNPSGARPVGANVGNFKLLPDEPLWAAAQIPTYENTFYAPRVLSDDGERLFFTSSDSLVARDTNGHEDVYEWEVPGVPGSGRCSEESTSFSAENEGCVDLISSGQSPRDSEFLDASPSGNDVFFTTLSSLLPQDYGLVDVYDARVGGGFPSPSLTQAECEGEACQSPSGAPQDTTPASSAYRGPGNVKQAKPRCSKGKVRRGKRCVPKKHRRQASRRIERVSR